MRLSRNQNNADKASDVWQVTGDFFPRHSSFDTRHHF